MATYTKADIVKQAMEYISELESQEAVSAEDSDFVGRKYDNMHAFLEEKKLAYWASGAVPDYVAEFVVQILGAAIAPRYVTDLRERAYFTQQVPGAIKTIRSLTAKPDGGEPTKHVYF